ncbi:MAG: hypothetical protein AAB229_09670 [Candidatus Hydrogenedentota bacterium]
MKRSIAVVGTVVMLAGIFLSGQTVSAAPHTGDAGEFSAFTITVGPQPFLVEFVSRNADHVARLDMEIYDDPGVRQQLVMAFGMTRQRSDGPWHDRLRRESSSRKPVLRATAPGVVRIAVEDYPEIAERWNVTSLPAYIIVSGKGKVLARREGMPTPSLFIAFIRDHIMPMSMPDTTAPSTVSSSPATYAAPPVPPIPVDNMVMVPWTAGAPREPVVTTTSPAESTVMSGYGREPLVQPAPASQPLPSGRNAAREPVVPAIAAGTRLDTVTSGRFTRSGAKEVFFEREFSSATLWTLDLKSSPDNVDIDLDVLDEEGNQLAHAEAPSGEEHIVIAVSAGKYKVRVFSFRDADIRATFELAERGVPLPADRIVPQLAGKALAVDEDRRVSTSDGYPSWIVFSAASPGRFKFTFAENDPEEYAFDVQAYNAAGEMIGTMKDDALVLETLTAGRIALKFMPEGSAGGSVLVHAAKHSEIDAGAVRTEIEAGSTKSGSVGGSAGLEKIYRIRMPRDARRGAGDAMYELVLSSDRAGADIDLEILKENGELVERSEGPTADETLRVTLQDGEERFVRVYVYRAIDPVPFTLMMKEAAAEAPARGTTPSRLNPPEDAPTLVAITPRLDRVGRNETDWYQFVPERSGLYNIMLDGGSTENDIDLAIHDADGTQMGISQNDHARESILTRLEAGQTFFLRVFAFQDSPGSEYKLWLQPLAQ